VVQYRNAANPQGELDEYVEKTMQGLSIIPALDASPRTLEELDIQVGQIWPGTESWRKVPESWFDPTQSGNRMNAISRASAEFRDRHMVRLIVDEVRSGERVFVLVGLGHAVAQEPVLRFELE
jgi:hypothetical protein